MKVDVGRNGLINLNNHDGLYKHYGKIHLNENSSFR